MIDSTAIERLQQFCLRCQQVEMNSSQAQRSLSDFWRQVRVTPAGCWAWSGRAAATLHCAKGASSSETLSIDPQHFAWVLEYGSASCDHSSKFLPTCATSLCIRPAHKIEILPLDAAFLLLVEWDLGEDDLRELSWRFRERVEAGDFEHYSWNNQLAARRTDFDQWLRGEGQRLRDTFHQKYQREAPIEAQPFLAHASVGWERQNDASLLQQKSDWRERVAVPRQEIPVLIERYKQMIKIKAAIADRWQATTRGREKQAGLNVDDGTILKQIERLCTRLVIHQNGCWTWDKPGVQFRIYPKGPLVSPHEVLWTIFSGVPLSPVWDTRVASHDSFSWCINPGHSDVLANTRGATGFLFHGQEPPIAWPEGAILSNEDSDRLRHMLYCAVERGEIPSMLDERRGIYVWRTDVRNWARDHQAEIDGIRPLLFKSPARREGAKDG